MGLFDCVAANPEERDAFDENERPVNRRREFSKSDHDISKRRTLPLFSSQTSLKNIRDVDFWRRRVLKFLFSPEGREDINVLKVPIKTLGYNHLTDFISSIPQDQYEEYLDTPLDDGIVKDDKVFWVRDGIAESGTFKWKGVILNEPCIGLQLDRKKAVPFGIHDGKGLFYCKPGHRAMVADDEVIPYKKFLREYLGAPIRKESFGIRGSVRLSAKALAAKNSKPGDRVYLPKEKKWAIVQWIGRIDNEVVVDLIYEAEKPEAGKPVTPDEPCMTRSLSFGDFIDEVGASEPTTPVGTTDVQSKAAPAVKNEVLNQAVTPAPRTPPPPPTPQEPVSSDESEDSSDNTDDDDDDDESSSGDDSKSEEEDDDNDNVFDQEVDDHESQQESDESDHVQASKITPIVKDDEYVETIVANKRDEVETYEPSEIVSLSPENSPHLPSPKRKGFFGFSSKKKRPKRKISKYETQHDIANDPEKDEVPQTPKSPTSLRPKSPNIFSGFGFKKSKKKVANPTVSESVENVPVQRMQKQKKAKSEWGRLFKSRSKSSLDKLNFSEPTTNVGCTTPLDEMIPPDKIPTPPPNSTDAFNERRIEADDFFEPVSPNEEKNLELTRENISNEKFPHVNSDEDVQSSDNQSSEEEDGDSSDSDEETSVRTQVAASIEPRTPPQLPSSPPPIIDKNTFKLEEAPPVSPRQNFANEPSPLPSSSASYQNEPAPVPSSLDMFKGQQIRNRPSSFGSFLARIKNQRPSPERIESPDSPEFPTGDTPKTFDGSVGPTENFNVDQNSTPQVGDANGVNPISKGYTALSESNSSLVSSIEYDRTADDRKTSITLPTSGVVVEINKSVVKPPSVTVRPLNDGDQDGITLDFLDVEEISPSCVTSPSPLDSPKRKNSKNNKGFSFSFSKKRKPSNPQTPSSPIVQTPTTPFEINDDIGDEGTVRHNNVENIAPNEIDTSQVKLRREEKERKPSLTSSFRNSFKRTFSLPRKKQTSMESDGENPKSPSSTINKPRPVTLYLDNNEVVQKRNSFKSKRPASVVVDIQPWKERHVSEDFSSSSSDLQATSPQRKSPNTALTPKQENVSIPKHRMFTTPSLFLNKKNKKPDEDEKPLIAKPSPTSNKSFYAQFNQETDEPRTPAPVSLASTPVCETPPPPLPKGPPPPLPKGPPPPLKHDLSFTLPEGSPEITKLKSALKQRKEIEHIPNGLKIDDRVLYYSGKGKFPGTVQRLFKDGTDKYTAMVKFDREISTEDEPLRLTREGDAYIITVEELITPAMFSPAPIYENQQVIEQNIAHSIPQTPLTPSVRFDGVLQEEQPDADEPEIEDEPESHDIPPPFQAEEVNMACGFRRGIQCHDKSCCLETILFTLFYTTNTFDLAMLYPNSQQEDSVTKNARRILRTEIVDPMRRTGVCLAPAIKKLRDAVKPLSGVWQTLSTDAEVMMFILFDQAFKLGKFISYSNEKTDFLHQLVVDAKDLSKSTTVQHLFETSLQLMGNIKLKTIPTPALILEMPRSNDKLVQYKAIIPNPSLILSHMMDDGTLLCICGAVANYKCRKCTAHSGCRSISFCENCKGTADIIHLQLTHEAELVALNQPIVVMDLVAVMCVKAGHYFSFVKCGNEKFSPWVFFDGTELENPKVCIEQNLGMWLDRLEKYPGKYQDALQYPLLTHILQDSHICIYQAREKSSSV